MDLKEEVDKFLSNAPDESTEHIFSVDFNKEPFMEENDTTFFDRAVKRLFNMLYDEGHLTKKPTVFAGFRHDKISIELFLGK